VNTAGHPHTLLRVDSPAPGAVFATSCPFGDKAYVTVSFYLYGDTAAAVAARDESAWTEWMGKLFTE
jgi:hypothetical protein